MIEWVNGDLAEHAVVAETWDSGVLWPGETFRLRLDDVVIVDPSAPPVGVKVIYLPVVAR